MLFVYYQSIIYYKSDYRVIVILGEYYRIRNNNSIITLMVYYVHTERDIQRDRSWNRSLRRRESISKINYT